MGAHLEQDTECTELSRSNADARHARACVRNACTPPRPLKAKIVATIASRARVVVELVNNIRKVLEVVRRLHAQGKQSRGK